MARKLQNLNRQDQTAVRNSPARPSTRLSPNIFLDSSKFSSSSGAIVCGLEEIDVLVTDEAIGEEMARIVQEAGVELIKAS